MLASAARASRYDENRHHLHSCHAAFRSTSQFSVGFDESMHQCLRVAQFQRRPPPVTTFASAARMPMPLLDEDNSRHDAPRALRAAERGPCRLFAQRVRFRYKFRRSDFTRRFAMCISAHFDTPRSSARTRAFSARYCRCAAGCTPQRRSPTNFFRAPPRNSGRLGRPVADIDATKIFSSHQLRRRS